LLLIDKRLKQRDLLVKSKAELFPEISIYWPMGLPWGFQGSSERDRDGKAEQADGGCGEGNRKGALSLG